MIDGSTIVIDVGKTHAKWTLLDERGDLVETRTRPNEAPAHDGYRILDAAGVERWLYETLAACPGMPSVRRIVPVGHGAAAALVREGQLFLPPMDYEDAVADSARQSYVPQRDPFSATGSPLLPCALNLGLQLHAIETARGPLPSDVTILTWAQYWAWRFCAVVATEVSSLGCHSDLWKPMDGGFSELAVRRGWAARLAPLRRAGAVLGTVTRDVAERTGLPPGCEVLCGLHDSNAALLAARAHEELAQSDMTVLSTGTWFVAMRSLASDAVLDSRGLSEDRDCLVNVDVNGRAVPSARFMGGREAEIICAGMPAASSESADAKQQHLGQLVHANARALPSFVQGVGPFPNASGRLENATEEPGDLQIIASLYLALMTDTMLDLIDSRERLLIEGRFAGDRIFTGALASLRPQQMVYICDGGNDLAFGALRLIDPQLQPPSGLERVSAFSVDIREYARDWRRYAGEASRIV